MRQINSLELEMGDTGKEFKLSEGAIFHGLQIKQHQILIWLSEITGAPKDHIVSFSNIIEYGSFDEDWVYIGFCSNDVHAGDQTFHVMADSNTMEILIAPRPFELDSPLRKSIEKSAAVEHTMKRKAGRPPKKETANVKANS